VNGLPWPVPFHRRQYQYRPDELADLYLIIGRLQGVLAYSALDLDPTALNIRTIYPVIEWYRSGLVSVG
jgi:hypothetical protein